MPVSCRSVAIRGRAKRSFPWRPLAGGGMSRSDPAPLRSVGQAVPGVAPKSGCPAACIGGTHPDLEPHPPRPRSPLSNGAATSPAPFRLAHRLRYSGRERASAWLPGRAGPRKSGTSCAARVAELGLARGRTVPDIWRRIEVPLLDMTASGKRSTLPVTCMRVACQAASRASTVGRMNRPCRMVTSPIKAPPGRHARPRDKFLAPLPRVRRSRSGPRSRPVPRGVGGRVLRPHAGRAR